LQAFQAWRLPERSGKIHFGDILSQSVTGGSAAGMQVGRGVDVAGITTQFSSGSFETTANATDLAIDGHLKQRQMPRIWLLTVMDFS